MTTAPAADQQRLLDVQALDTRLDQLAHRRRTLPELARLTELDAQLADVASALVTSRTAAQDLRRELVKAEGDVEQVRQRAARNTERLNAGQGSAKDLQGMQHELESLARRQADLEEVELEVMERLEAHESALAEVTKAHEQLTAEVDKVAAARDAAYAELDAEVAVVTAAREGAVRGIDEGLLALYTRLRGQLGGVGAAALRGSRCEGCRLDLNPADLDQIRSASPDTVVRCEECGRILVRLPQG